MSQKPTGGMETMEPSTGIYREMRPPTPPASPAYLEEKSRDSPSMPSNLAPDPSLESPLLAPEDTIRHVLFRLLDKHESLRMPSQSEFNGFLGLVRMVPDTPVWIWYGMLDFAVTPVIADSCGGKEGQKIVGKVNEEEEEAEGSVRVDFKILDEFLNTYIGGSEVSIRFWDMLFYYMYLQVEGKFSGYRTVVEAERTAVDAERTKGEQDLKPLNEDEGLKPSKEVEVEPDISEEITPPPSPITLYSREEHEPWELQDIGAYSSKWDFYKSVFLVLVVSIFILFPHQYMTYRMALVTLRTQLISLVDGILSSPALQRWDVARLLEFFWYNILLRLGLITSGIPSTAVSTRILSAP